MKKILLIIGIIAALLIIQECYSEAQDASIEKNSGLQSDINLSNN